MKSNPMPQAQPLDSRLVMVSPDSLDPQLTGVLRLRALRAARLAELKARLAAVQQEFASPIGDLDRQVLRRESSVQAYWHAQPRPA